MAEVLILKGAREPTNSAAYATWKALNNLGADDYYLENYADLVFTIKKGIVNCYLHTTGRDLASYDLVYIRDFHGYEHERNTVAFYLKHKDKKFINEDTSSFQHISKLTQYFALATKGIPVPDTIYAKPEHLAKISGIVYPAVLKSIVGSNGSNNVLVRSKRQLSSEGMPKAVLQPFIPNDYDMRVIVADDEVLLAYKRMRARGKNHRNNVALGARREIVEPVPSVITELAVGAAKAVGRNLAGVDIIRDKESGDHYILEVNFNFGMLELDNRSAKLFYKRLADYLHRRAQ